MRKVLATLALVLFATLSQTLAQTPTQPAGPTASPVPPAQPVTDKSASKPDTPAVDAPLKTAEGMSTCYFYRPRLYRGSAVRIGIFVDGTMAVNLVNGRWTSIQLPAGHHVIKPKDDQSGIEIDMEPGQSYYIRSGWGEEGLFHGAHKNIMLMMKEQANYEIKQLKPLDDKDVAWGKPNAASLKQP
jgi:hypothetical protein